MAQPLQAAAKAKTTASEAHASSNAPKEKPTAGEKRFEAYYAQQHLVDDFPQLLAALRKPLPITFRIFDATRDGTYKRLEAEARALGATRFIILTAVDEVMVDYGKDTQRSLRETGVSELRQHADAGQFPPGSMGPKVEAVIAFLQGNPGAEVLITSPEALADALAGDRGTWIRG